MSQKRAAGNAAEVGVALFSWRFCLEVRPRCCAAAADDVRWEKVRCG
jgi:hypothetical protein